ncbi:exodeoxyribonuclease VII large subunit [Oscillatoria sp. CS-180]|uniref:exodeoxyribonuclease VII large subunit n=1 Tax=Oscillatoria sp. CS-180 TaxID=3021720 RepID=UPI0023303B5C|nr:exodeoxyribonuclease VII large subunit [Oscillatoria sp. CS-180]MDB9528091.1 exodeoxyribonuclease VII large subunit [Oscillatoria sp. CS-180]
MIQSHIRIEVPEHALSVAGVTDYIQELLEQDPQLYRVWVMGEVSSANERNGHIFFTLQDTESNVSIQAVVWRSQRSKLASPPIAGEQVFLLGQVRVYTARGQYQLNTLQLIPAGAGIQALRRQQLYQRLAAEGLFENDIKRSLPAYPQVIAVVTSAQAAAWGDIQRTLRQRQPGLKVLLSPAVVQGDQAPASIAIALNRVAKDARADALILARGGGAREDLEAFDTEQVVRAVSTSPIPVVTGIGHERDETLADLAADFCAHTPTAAAESVVPHIEDLLDDLEIRKQALKATLQSTLEVHHQFGASLRHRLEQLYLNQKIRQEQQSLVWQKQQIRQILQHRLQTAQQHCRYLSQTLKTLDPESVLRRGYAVVRAEGDRVINSNQQVSVGDNLHIRLAEGAIIAKVKTVEE